MISRISVVAACWSRASRSSAVSRAIGSSGVSGGALGAGGGESIWVLAGAERARLALFRVAAVSRAEPFCIVGIAACDLGMIYFVYGGVIDTVEVTLRLYRSVAERSRDPAERARYEAFLELVSNAATQADIKEAVQLLTAIPAIRQRRLKRAFDDIRRRAEAAGLTAEEVEHELTARKRERRTARRR